MDVTFNFIHEFFMHESDSIEFHSIVGVIRLNEYFHFLFGEIEKSRINQEDGTDAQDVFS